MANPAISDDPEPDVDPNKLTARIFMAITPDMLKEIEDYRFSKRFKSQSGAVRKLLEHGLRAAAWEARKTK